MFEGYLPAFILTHTRAYRKKTARSRRPIWSSGSKRVNSGSAQLYTPQQVVLLNSVTLHAYRRPFGTIAPRVHPPPQRSPGCLLGMTDAVMVHFFQFPLRLQSRKGQGEIGLLATLHLKL